jgi:ABC-type nitrate/sulfonate/bicarbonate transport system substrate-binding protein
VRSVGDLRGRTVGLPSPGGTEASVLAWLLGRAGIEPSAVATVALGDRGLAPALDGERVQAVVAAEPWLSSILAQGGVTALVDLRRAEDRARWLPGPAVHAAVFTRAEGGPDTAALVPFLSGVLEGIEGVRRGADVETAARLGSEPSGLPEAWQARLAAARAVLIPDGRVGVAALRGGLALAGARAPLPAAVLMPRRLDRLLRPEPLERALGASRP